MNALRRWCTRSGRAVVAVEFALTLPILLLFLGAVTDFGIVYYIQGGLSSVIAAGAAYATITDENNGSVAQTDIQTAMRGAAAQSLPGFSVTVAAGNPAQCYCLTGSAPAQMSTATCGSTCSSGGSAGKYVQLTATVTYQAMLPAYSMLGGSTVLSKSAWVPLQ